MERDFKFAVDEIQKINLEDYDSDEFAIARMGYLSDKPNSHGLKISAEVLKEYAKTVLGKWVIADMTGVIDSGTHTDNQKIVGRIPENQDVEFVVDEDGYTRAFVDVVISKLYAKDYCAIFKNDNKRSVSVEMRVCCSEDDDKFVESFNIAAVSTLGHNYCPSCPDSDIVFTRFSEDEADNFFAKVQNNRLTALERFAEERKQSMAEKEKYVSHPINTSKKAVYDGEWDGNKAKQDLVKEKNFSTLAPKVCMRLEDGWENREVTKCGYPVMMLHDGEWVYSKIGLASALSYAKKENETSVVTKVEKIRKKLGLDDNEGKEETVKMSKEIEFAAVDIGDMWSKVYSAIRSHDAWRYGIEGIYEEDNKKFAVLKDESGTLYRLDFSLTEEGVTVADELIEVQKEFIDTDKVVKFAEPENVEEYRTFADDEDDDDDDDDEIEGRKAWAKVIKKVQDHEGDGAYVDSIEDDHIIYTKDDVRYRVNAKIKTDADDKSVDAEIDWNSVKKDKVQKMSADEMEAEMARLKKDIEDRDNIIMEKDTELAELRAFKKGVEDKEKAMSVESVMEEIKGFIDENKFKEFREEGLACEMAAIDGWKNKVKAFCFEAGVKNPKKNKRDEIFSFAMDVTTYRNTTNSLWD